MKKGVFTQPGSNSDLGERRADVRFHLESGPDLAQPVRLISAIRVVSAMSVMCPASG